MRPHQLGVVLLIGSVLPHLSLAAQKTGTADLTGRVTSSVNGRPISGATIGLPVAGRFTVTDSSGAFRLDSLPAGRQTLRVSLDGRTNEEYEVTLTAGKALRLAVLLDAEAVNLSPIVVQARHVEDRWGLAGFWERKRQGWGRFVTREELSSRPGEPMSGFLAGLGLPLNSGHVSTFIRGNRCLVPVKVDGILVEGDYLHTVRTDDVGGIELYRGGLDAPLAFSAVSGGASFGGSRVMPSCGLVLIWTRDWRTDLDY